MQPLQRRLLWDLASTWKRSWRPQVLTETRIEIAFRCRNSGANDAVPSERGFVALAAPGVPVDSADSHESPLIGVLAPLKRVVDPEHESPFSPSVVAAIGGRYEIASDKGANRSNNMSY